MEPVKQADSPGIPADFFLKLADAAWCMVSGIYDQKLIAIIRNAGYRRDAGKLSERLFGEFGAAGGHRNAVRAQIPVEHIARRGVVDACGDFVLARIKKSGPASA